MFKGNKLPDITNTWVKYLTKSCSPQKKHEGTWNEEDIHIFNHLWLWNLFLSQRGSPTVTSTCHRKKYILWSVMYIIEMTTFCAISGILMNTMSGWTVWTGKQHGSMIMADQISLPGTIITIKMLMPSGSFCCRDCGFRKIMQHCFYQ
jgi:hypothetical protein